MRSGASRARKACAPNAPAATARKAKMAPSPKNVLLIRFHALRSDKRITSGPTTSGRNYGTKLRDKTTGQDFGTKQRKIGNDTVILPRNAKFRSLVPKFCPEFLSR